MILITILFLEKKNKLFADDTNLFIDAQSITELKVKLIIILQIYMIGWTQIGCT